MKIAEIKKDTPVEGVTALVEKRAEAFTKNGKPYLTLTIKDKTGSIQAKLWDYSPDRHSFIKEGDVIAIWAVVDEYNGSLQLNLKSVEASLESPLSFVKSTRFSVDEMWSDLVGIVGTFKEPLTKFVCEEILLKHDAFIEAYKKAPAAKSVHNAWYGGLLEHVHSLCSIADPVISHYQKRYEAPISRDKVLFGLMMHDAGKIVEYDYSKASFDLTGLGVLANHIVLGPAWVFEKANSCKEAALIEWKMSPEKFKFERAHLMHILAAHHGQIEWGSPVRPATLEAILVHHLDNLDSKVMHALDYVQGKPGPILGFSEKSFIESTPFYQAKI